MGTSSITYLMSKEAEVDLEVVLRTFLHLVEVGLESGVEVAVGNVEFCAFWVMGEAVSYPREAEMNFLSAACCWPSVGNDRVCRKRGASNLNRMLQLQLRRVWMPKPPDPPEAPWRNLAEFASILDFSDALPRPSRELLP